MIDKVASMLAELKLECTDFLVKFSVDDMVGLFKLGILLQFDLELSPALR
jgi:hypothetical protein